MAFSSSSSSYAALLPSSLIACCFIAAAFGSANFNQDVNVTWGDGRVRILENGQLLTLSLDSHSGSGFQSKKEYLFGMFDMQIKLVRGNSAGTVTTFYLSSQGPTRDEIDFQFLGNLSGDPYILQTNVFVEGKGKREQQFYLWFDPTTDFHTYSILWNPRHISFLVDGVPIRDFKNNEMIGVPFPNKQHMRMYASLLNGESWATRGGQVKTDYTQAPFVASYREFNADACMWSSGRFTCESGSSSEWLYQELDGASQEKMKEMREKYMIDDYCTDLKRFSLDHALECFFA